MAWCVLGNSQRAGTMSDQDWPLIVVTDTSDAIWMGNLIRTQTSWSGKLMQWFSNVSLHRSPQGTC